MLTVGLAVLSLWPFLLGLFGKAKVTTSQVIAPTYAVQQDKWEWFSSAPESIQVINF